MCGLSRKTLLILLFLIYDANDRCFTNEFTYYFCFEITIFYLFIWFTYIPQNLIKLSKWAGYNCSAHQ